MHEALGAGRQVLCLGDLNIRVGELGDDVAGVPMDAGPVAGLAGPVVGSVPAARQSQDRKVDSHALGLMLGLNACGCVVLNGRAPGDTEGKCTCFSSRGRDVVGCSVVDYGIVSAGLYESVRDFSVLPRQGELESQDHAALSVRLDLQRALQVTAPGGVRCPRTLRPQGDRRRDYVEALQGREAALAALQARVEAGTISWGDAVDQLLALTRAAALDTAGTSSRQPPGSHAPWFTPACTQARDGFRAAWLAWWQAKQQGASQQLVQGLHVSMVEGRQAYKRATTQAKRDYQHRYLEGLIETYFSAHQRDFWRVLKGGKGGTCPVTDVHEWTQHFDGIMGVPPPAQSLSAAALGVRQGLLDACRREEGLFDGLSEPFTVAEVGQVLGSLPTGKAPDLQGLTCEALKAPAVELGEAADGGQDGAEGGSQGDPAEPSFVCQPFVECVTSIMRRALACGCEGGCEVLECSKVAPVPKPPAAQSPADKDHYRPIGVGSVLGRVLDRLMQRRLDGVVEREGVRAPTQCGFRGKYGCLDALFTMQHLVSQVHWRGPGSSPSRSKLWAVFVDFRKAFDLVRRDLLITRCRELGVHGPFLAALTALYDRVLLRVCVNGRLGPTFQTHRGTRQGSELSPLLFGLFMDLLHELIKLQVPGAGPVIGSLAVPELMYADDVTLLAWNPSDAQRLLDCLALFCELFDMEVNLAKTHVVVFRRPRAARPTAILSYQGHPLAFVDSCRYLGLLLHATKGFTAASDDLALKGRKAMLGLLPLLKLHHITQPDLRLRLFDILVEPVLSFGAHIWGPSMCSSWLSAGYTAGACAADDVQLGFLRELYGAHRTACRDVLLRDTHRVPMPYRWLSLAASWWDKLAAMDSDRLAHQAWTADLQLLLAGCVDCWSFHLLEGLEEIGFVTPDQWRSGTPGVTVESLQSISVTKGDVMAAARRYQADHWQRVAAAHVHPRQQLSAGKHLCTHSHWVHAVESGALPDRKNAPSYLQLCLPRGVLQCLGRYRLGGHHLYGRLHGPASPVHRLACPLCGPRGVRRAWHDVILARCGADRPEDLLHFMWECPAYDHIRDKFASVFVSSSATSVSLCMQQLFSTKQQRRLARCVAAMDAYRRHLLGRGSLHGVQPRHQPEGYVAALVYPACLRQGAGWLPVGSTWLRRLGGSEEALGITLAALVVAGLWVVACMVVFACMYKLQLLIS